MDDRVVHTQQLPFETEEEHLACYRKLVHKVFDILEANNLCLKPKKCLFEQSKVNFLGVIMG